MFTWIKSLLSDVSAGTLLVLAATTLVVSLMVALGQIASLQPDANVLTVASEDSVKTPMQAQTGGTHEPAHPIRSSVSVMVPVNAIR